MTNYRKLVRATYNRGDGEEVKQEARRIVALWTTEYRQAFVSFASRRPGWTRENAEAEAAIVQIPFDNRFIIRNDPATKARADVLEYERLTVLCGTGGMQLIMEKIIGSSLHPMFTDKMRYGRDVTIARTTRGLAFLNNLALP